jgi:hypothetical protein
MTTEDRYELAVVVWHDAHADAEGWTSLLHVDHDPCEVVSVGWLLKRGRGKKRGHVSIAQSTIGDWCVDSILHIPRKMVVRKIKLGTVRNDGKHTEVDRA